MVYKSSPVGNEILCQMFGIDEGLLNDLDRLRRDFLAALGTGNYDVREYVSSRFPVDGLDTEGYTGSAILGESHASISTYPERGSLTFNIQTCRGPEDGRETYKFLKKRWKPTGGYLVEIQIPVDEESKNDVEPPKVTIF